MANDFETAARQEKAERLVAEILRRATEQHVATDKAELIFWFDSFTHTDSFLTWRRARCVSAPSDECKRLVRRMLLARLSTDEVLKLVGPCGGMSAEPYAFTNEDRELCRQIENDRALASYDDAKMRGEP